MSSIKNVIFIMLDSLQHNYLGCYGNDWISTPNFDRFARNGILFENAYSEGVPTIPVRRALMTGRFTLPFGGWQPLTPDDTTITDLLWTRDQQTALVYDASPMRLPKYGYSRGFDYVKFCNGHELDHELYGRGPLDPSMKAEDYVTPSMISRGPDGEYDEATKDLLHGVECVLRLRQNWRDDGDNYVAVVSKEADFWLREKRDPSRPFFLWIDSFDPHEPWDPPSTWKKEPCPYDADYKGNPIILAPWIEVEGNLPDEDLQHIRALYAESVTVVDKWIGNLLDSVRQQGLWDETMIIITSDHGFPMGKAEHGHGILRKCRPWPYEELVHVPLIMHVPGATPQRVSSFVQNVDISATIMDAFGYLHSHKVEKAGHEAIRTYDAGDMQGISLLPVIYGETDKVRDWAIAGYHGMSWSLITEDYSYIHWLPQGNVDSLAFLQQFYDDAATGGNAGKKSREAIKTDETMWTCTPGAEVRLPENDELYDRRLDRFQLNNIADKNPEKAKAMLQQLKGIIAELRAS